MKEQKKGKYEGEGKRGSRGENGGEREEINGKKSGMKSDAKSCLKIRKLISVEQVLAAVLDNIK